MSEQQGRWHSLGQTYRVDQVDRVPDHDPRSGDHLWTIATMYRWGGPDIERPTLDQENLLLLVGPGCYYCEQTYTERLATRRCPGPAPS